MTSDLPISEWLVALQAGDEDAAQRLWEGYYARMVALASRKLQGIARRAADEEDVALSAFDSFCQGVQQQRYPRLNDRDDLWRLLFVITARKAADLAQHTQRQKRGGGRVRGDSVFAAESSNSDRAAPGWQQVVGREPTPEFSCQIREELERLLALLSDPKLAAIAVAKLEGYTNEEIAAQLQVVVRTVERKLELIRRRWSEEGFA